MAEFDGRKVDRLEGSSEKKGGLFIRKKQANSESGESHVFQRPDIKPSVLGLQQLAERKKREREESSRDERPSKHSRHYRRGEESSSRREAGSSSRRWGDSGLGSSVDGDATATPDRRSGKWYDTPTPKHRSKGIRLRTSQCTILASHHSHAVIIDNRVLIRLCVV